MWKYVKIIFVIKLVFSAIFIVHVLFSTGYFRTIENHFDGSIVKRIELPGAEDITVSVQDSFAVISSTQRGIYPSINDDTGGLFLMDLKDEAYSLTPLTKTFNKPFAPHGISILKKDNTYHIMAISHTLQGHSIEHFNLKNKILTHQQTLTDPLVISPNDIVMIDKNRFYFTNDHSYPEGLRRTAEDYLGLELSTIVYFDGENYNEVASGIAYANGINFDAKRNLLFVASPRKFLIKVYKTNPNGSLNFIEDIDCNTGVDNIEFDEFGNLWVGAHPNLLEFGAYAKGKTKYAPSEIIKINYRGTNNYSIETIYLEDGQEMSGATVAAPFGNLILTGNVLDTKFLILNYEN